MAPAEVAAGAASAEVGAGADPANDQDPEADGGLNDGLAPTDPVKSMSPIQENSMQYGYDENDNNNMSNETKCETNYSINSKWNNMRNKHLTKHDTNDDVDLDNCVVHTVR